MKFDYFGTFEVRPGGGFPSAVLAERRDSGGGASPLPAALR